MDKKPLWKRSNGSCNAYWMNKPSRLDRMIKCPCRLMRQLRTGTGLIINHAMPVIVKADGKTRTLYTTERTVQAAIDEANISIRSQDKVIPPLRHAFQTGYERLRSSVSIREYSENAFRSSLHHREEGRSDSLRRVRRKLVQTGKEGIVVKQI